MRRAPVLVSLFVLLVGLAAGVIPASADVAPDASGTGPYAVTSAEYQFPAAIDPDVMSTMPTELWARVYRPSSLLNGPFPVVVFLHGNHGTCGTGTNPRVDNNVQYTFSGTCPPGYVVTPNHLGYAYLAERLASWGYVVVSINANRGITGRNGTPAEADDRGLNLARGRLVLKHLQRLAEWDSGAAPTPASLGVSLAGALDLGRLGLMGHSRGGEGIRAAYNLYRDAGSPWPSRIQEYVNFTALFEIGPVDGQTSRQLNVDGVVWNVLLPMCDGDVSNLQGVKPFDRAQLLRGERPATQKSTYTVWGANHNFYNTEWQQSDSSGCSGAGNPPLWSPGQIGSPTQRQTGLASVLALFRGNVGAAADESFNQNFDPSFDLPPSVGTVTRVDRGYTASPSAAVNTTIEDFDQPTGVNSYGFLNGAAGITISHGGVPDHNSIDAYGRAGAQRAGAITWAAPGAGVFFQTNWTAPGTGREITGFDTLNLRLSRQASGNPGPTTNFSVQLVAADGTLSDPVALADYASLAGPAGGPYANPHPILQTVRIGLLDFGIFDLTRVRGVRLTFDATPSGAIYVANIRVNNSGPVAVAARHASAESPSERESTAAGSAPPARGTVSSVRSVASTAGGLPGVEITVQSEQPFEARDELPVLWIGTRSFTASRYPAGGDTGSLIFQLSGDEFASLSSGEPVSVRYGTGPGPQWTLGTLDTSLLDR